VLRDENKHNGKKIEKVKKKIEIMGQAGQWARRPKP